ncbi:MAG: hypothetical protein AAF944_04690 [Bacteroidota bacterium]
MRVIYNPPPDIHTPSELPDRILEKLNLKFWASRKAYWESRPQQYWPLEFQQWRDAAQHEEHPKRKTP